MSYSPKLGTALAIIERLSKHGFEAFIVGGFVRDYCIRVQGSRAEAGDFFASADERDIDITSAAEPAVIEALFPGSVASGLKYGTMTIKEGPYTYEHTTFRSDKFYPEGSRKPVISYAKTLGEDVLRRDFRMNALALNSSLEVIDLVEGRTDIEAGMIRTVGEPAERFREDSLRKLRALRFVSTLGFELSDEVRAALKEDASLPGVSAERIRQELTKILMGDYVYQALREMADLGLFAAFVPEIVPTIGFEQHSKYHDFSVFEHIIRAVSNAPKDEDIRTAAFLHDIAKPLKFTRSQDGQGHFKGHDAKGAELARTILERLKYPKQSVETITRLIAGHHSLPRPDIRAVRRYVSEVGYDMAFKQLELAYADNRSKKREGLKLSHLDELRLILEEVKASTHPLELKDLAVNGDDLIAHLELSLGERRLLGTILAELLNHCLAEPELNQRAELLKLSEEIFIYIRED